MVYLFAKRKNSLDFNYQKTIPKNSGKSHSRISFFFGLYGSINHEIQLGLVSISIRRNVSKLNLDGSKSLIYVNSGIFKRNYSSHDHSVE